MSRVDLAPLKETPGRDGERNAESSVEVRGESSGSPGRALTASMQIKGPSSGAEEAPVSSIQVHGAAGKRVTGSLHLKGGNNPLMGSVQINGPSRDGEQAAVSSLQVQGSPGGCPGKSMTGCMQLQGGNNPLVGSLQIRGPSSDGEEVALASMQVQGTAGKRITGCMSLTSGKTLTGSMEVKGPHWEETAMVDCAQVTGAPSDQGSKKELLVLAEVDWNGQRYSGFKGLRSRRASGIVRFTDWNGQAVLNDMLWDGAMRLGNIFTSPIFTADELTITHIRCQYNQRIEMVISHMSATLSELFSSSSSADYYLGCNA
ncbi:uncharacterized protein [Anolis sagrei]|uniref:uncharacterized protein n=1 Tax=Anolis sagrei TaxID=38937 RepID=UPI003521AC55